MSIRSALLATLLIALPFASHADPVQIGALEYGGNGCPAGTVDLDVSSDQRTVRIHFSDFVARAGGSSGKSIDYKSCGLSVPIKVKSGYRVGLLVLDYEGSAQLKKGAKATVGIESFFAGVTGPKASIDLSGPISDDFDIGNPFPKEDIIWSACGNDTILRVNTNLRVRTSLSKSSAFVRLASARSHQLLVRSCD